MKGLIKFFIRRYVFAIAVFGALVIFGIIGAFGLGLDLFPEIDIPIVSVTTALPGGSPEQMAQDVSKILEDEIATLAGLSTLTSTNVEGASIIVAEFEFGVDLDQAANDINQKVSAVAADLPEDALASSVEKVDIGGTSMLNIAISAPGEDLFKVQEYADDEIKPLIQAIKGVAKVSIAGEIEREIHVLLDPALLQVYNLSPSQIASTVGSAATDVSAGSLDFDVNRILIAGRNQPTSIGEVEEIVIDDERGLRVSDVGVVRDTSAESESFVRLNGDPVALLEVQKLTGSNTVAVAAQVREKLKGIELPDGYEMKVVGDTTKYIRGTALGAVQAIIVAILAVGLVVFLFVGRLGSVFSVVVAIPITLTGTIVVLLLFGFTFNMMTLLAITVAVGMVVDDSIVIAENTETKREQGLDKVAAATEGAGEVSVAVLASALALLSVFIPISLLPGIVGQFFAAFGISMAGTVVFSYFEAMFFLPVRSAYLPNPYPPSWKDFIFSFIRIWRDTKWGISLLKRFLFWIIFLIVGFVLYRRLGLIGLAFLPALPLVAIMLRYLLRIVLSFIGAIAYTCYRIVDASVKLLRRGYVNSLKVALRVPILVLILAVLAFASIFLAEVSFTFTPNSDESMLNASVELPVGINMETTNYASQLYEQAILEFPEVSLVQTTVGVGSEGNAQPERAEFLLELTPKAGRAITAYDLAFEIEKELRRLTSEFPFVKINVEASDSSGTSSSDFNQQIRSNDLTLFRERELAIRSHLDKTSYFRSVTTEASDPIEEQAFLISQGRLTGTGLSVSDIFNTIRIYNVGLEDGEMLDEGEKIPIVTKINPLFIQDEQAFLSLPVYAPSLQSSLPLSQLGNFDSRRSSATIRRASQSYANTFEGTFGGEFDSQTVTQNIKEELTNQGLLDEKLTMGPPGGFDPEADLAASAPIAFGVALFLVYIVIAVQFNSFRFPFYLMLTVPLALVGALWLLDILNIPLDVFGVLGIIMLIALVVKNAILLLEVVVTMMETGKMSLKEALLKAGGSRLRPIIMTALTVVVISIPLLISNGDGAELQKALGAVILGGVVFSTLLTLYVVPAAFYLFERRSYSRPKND